jgi:cytosine/adenosine deaminase-related metal-dependent hydrolase
MSGLVIHRAKWVAPVTTPVLENGAVAVFHDKIVAVGRTHEILSRFHGELIDHGDAILCPGLVNCHTHMELAGLHMRLSPTGSFTRWVSNMLEAKENLTEQDEEDAIKNAISGLMNEGIIAIGDVGNTTIAPTLLAESHPLDICMFFQEVICLKRQDAPDLNAMDMDLKVLEHEGFLAAIAPHACYSVFPGLIKAIKNLCNERNRPFSIHVAESQEEMEFLASGTGPMRAFLEKKGKWPLEFHIPETSPIRYLYNLEALDSGTICVHCVHLDDDDLNLLASSGATACLCPRSNLFLGSGIPRAAKLVFRGIPIALGTDSLASNDKLSIFAEMSSLARLAPEISSETIFRAATLGGAAALKLHDRIGSLEPEKKANFLSIRTANCKTPQEVYDFLIHYTPSDTGKENMQWVRQLSSMGH